MSKGGLSLYQLLRNVETVVCPRKGPLGCEISLVICGQLYASEKKACEDVGCSKAVKYAATIRALRLMPKRKNLSHREIYKMVEEGRDLEILEEPPEEDIFEDEEKGED